MEHRHPERPAQNVSYSFDDGTTVKSSGWMCELGERPVPDNEIWSAWQGCQACDIALEAHIRVGRPIQENDRPTNHRGDDALEVLDSWAGRSGTPFSG